MAATFDKAKAPAAPAQTPHAAPASAGRAAKVNNPAIASMAARAHVNPGQLGDALLWVISNHDTSDPDHPDHLKTMQSVAKVAPDFHAENAKQLLAGTYAPSAGGAHDAQAHGDKHAQPTPVPDGILSSQIHQLAAGSKGMDRGGLAILENSDPHLSMAVDPSQRVPGWFAGMILGAKLQRFAERGVQVVGFNVSDDRAYFIAEISRICADFAAGFDIGVTITPNDINICDGYVGAGYAKSRPDEIATVRSLARTDGVVLDPVYTGKAFGCGSSPTVLNANQIDHLTLLSRGFGAGRGSGTFPSS
jgi:hypothetical protein